MALRGIGRWTADVFLTMCLLRPDVWPVGDRALAVGAGEVLGLATTPSQEELEATAGRWRPFRALAARVCWNHYLGVRGRPVALPG
jgi:DNA-3-methyladenine glycosylase II